MSAFWIAAGIFVLWSIAYVEAHMHLRHVRPFKAYFDWACPIEEALWKFSRTILMARLITLISIIVTIHDLLAPQLVGFDWSPILPPEYVKYVPLAGIGIGVLMEMLRRWTTQSLEEKRDA